MLAALRLALLPSLPALMGRWSSVKRVRVQLGRAKPAAPVATVQRCPHCLGRRTPRRPSRWWPFESQCRHCGGTGVATIWRRELPAKR